MNSQAKIAAVIEQFECIEEPADLNVLAGLIMDLSDDEKAKAAARELGLEGIVSKRRGTAYRSGKVDFWRKTKCTVSSEFAVIGFEACGRSSLRSLRLARLVDGELVTCGSAGSGLGEAMAREIRAALDAGQAVVVDLENRGFTPASELRHPVIRGWHAG